MKSQKKAAIVIGILFLIALVLNIIASEIFKPILDSADYLTKVYPQKHLIVVGNILNIICAIAMIFIPIVLFSVVTQIHRYLAIGYIVFRGLEGILFLYIAIKTFSFIDISNKFLSSANTINAFNLSIGNALHSEIHWATVVYLIAFCCGALMFYSLLLKSKLVPKWLSVWGLAAVLILTTGTIMDMFELGIFKTMPLMQGMTYFAPPIALNEFVLSLWLIVKGFNISDQ